MVKKISACLISTCLLIVVAIGSYILLNKNSVKIITFDKQVETYLEGDYHSGSDKLYAFNQLIRKSYRDFVDKEVDEAYRANAKFAISANKMDAIEVTKWSYDALKKDQLIQVVRSTLKKCQKLYPLKGVNAIILPSDGTLEGVTVANNLIVFHVGINENHEAVKKELEWACYHEYMHLISETLALKDGQHAFPPESMLDDMILEGKAVVFANQQTNGYQSLAMKKIQVMKPWAAYKSRLQEKPYKMIDGRIYSAGDFEFPKLDLYVYGEKYVLYALSKRPEFQPEWWSVKDKDFYICEDDLLNLNEM